MQHPTLPPWLWGPSMYGQRVFKPAGPRELPAVPPDPLPLDRVRQRSRVTIFTYGRDDSDRLLRYRDWSGGSMGIGVSMREAPPAGAPPGGGWRRLPLDEPAGPWRVAVPPPLNIAHVYPQNFNLEWVDGAKSTGGGGGAGGGGREWGVARGWGIFVALLTLLLLLARIAEKCIEKKITRRRQAEEWSLPHVGATTERDIEAIFLNGVEGVDDIPDAINADLPPPYTICSDCSANVLPNMYGPKPTTDSMAYEHPPPPYSDTQLEFSNKDGEPTIKICDKSTDRDVNYQASTSEQNTQNDTTTDTAHPETESAPTLNGVNGQQQDSDNRAKETSSDDASASGNAPNESAKTPKSRVIVV